MKSLTVCRLLIVLSVLLSARHGKAQDAIMSFPDQYVLLRYFGNAINDTLITENRTIEKIIPVETAIGSQFTDIKNWEEKYMEYLQKVDGYANMLKSGTTLYLDGVEMLRNLNLIKKAIGMNPQGVVATAFMNSLLLEAAVETVKTYTELKEVVAKGGPGNMLNTSERTEMLWSLSENMARLNTKLRKLANDIAYYNCIDVWHRATAGFGNKPRSTLAGQCFDNWKRRAKVETELGY